jgi:hypothetical protein
MTEYNPNSASDGIDEAFQKSKHLMLGALIAGQAGYRDIQTELRYAAADMFAQADEIAIGEPTYTPETTSN